MYSFVVLDGPLSVDAALSEDGHAVIAVAVALSSMDISVVLFSLHHLPSPCMLCESTVV